MANDKLDLNLDEKTKKDLLKINKYGNDDENYEAKTDKISESEAESDMVFNKKKKKKGKFFKDKEDD